MVRLQIKIVLLILSVLTAVDSHATSLRELWLNIPAQLAPTLDASDKIEMLDYVDMQAKAGAKNILEGTSIIDTLTTDYLSVKLSVSRQLEIKLLPVAGADSIICAIETFYGPAEDSKITFYDQKWNRIGDFKVQPQDIMSKPDQMTEEKYLQAKELFNLGLVSAHLNPNNNEMNVSIQTTVISKEEKSLLKDLILQKTFKWEDKTFK